MIIQAGYSVAAVSFADSRIHPPSSPLGKGGYEGGEAKASGSPDPVPNASGAGDENELQYYILPAVK